MSVAIRATRIDAIHDSDRAEQGVEVSVVMPCLNEERTVGSCIKKALKSLQDLGVDGEIVVSDNGSTDASIQIAKDAGARVVHCPTRGYGAAIQYGVEKSCGRAIIMGDADDSYAFDDLELFITAMGTGDYDMVVGNRFMGGIESGAMPWKNRYIGNPVLSGILRLLYGGNVRDSHCGLRIFTREAYDKISPDCPGMEFASELVVKAHLKGLRTTEVPTILKPDGRDRAPHLCPWRDGIRHLQFLFSFRPSVTYLTFCTFALALPLSAYRAGAASLSVAVATAVLFFLLGTVNYLTAVFAIRRRLGQSGSLERILCNAPSQLSAVVVAMAGFPVWTIVYLQGYAGFPLFMLGVAVLLQVAGLGVSLPAIASRPVRT